MIRICETKVCTIVEIIRPIDINGTKIVVKKLEVYAPLVINLQIMHSSLNSVNIGSPNFLPLVRFNQF